MKMASRKDFYKVLGVAKTAALPEIKRAYKKAALQWCGSPPPPPLGLSPRGARALRPPSPSPRSLWRTPQRADWTGRCPALYNSFGHRHPDKVAESEKEAAQLKFQEVAEAYEILSDEELRGKYDRGEEVTGQPQQQQQQQPFGHHFGHHGHFPGGGFPQGGFQQQQHFTFNFGR